MRGLGRHGRSHLVVGDDAVLVLLALVDRLVGEFRSTHVVAADLLPAAGVDAATLDIVAGDGGAAGGARRSPADLDEVLVGVHAVGASGTARNVCRRWNESGMQGGEAGIHVEEFFSWLIQTLIRFKAELKISSCLQQVTKRKIYHLI